MYLQVLRAFLWVNKAILPAFQKLSTICSGVIVPNIDVKHTSADKVKVSRKQVEQM